jgi:predicted esterase
VPILISGVISQPDAAVGRASTSPHQLSPRCSTTLLLDKSCRYFIWFTHNLGTFGQQILNSLYSQNNISVMIAPQFKSHYFTTSSGTKSHYLQGGDSSGSLLICLHGLGGSTATFLPLAPFLPQSHNIVLVDFQGFGKTPLASSSAKISIEGHVTDLDDLIAFLQRSSGTSASSKVVIIGHSLGAIVALHFAAKHPYRIGGLALLGPGRAAGHIPAARQRMTSLAITVRKSGIRTAADGAAVSNFYEDS